MTINDLNRIWICDGYVVGLNSDNLSQLLVGFVNCPVAATMPALIHEP